MLSNCNWSDQAQLKQGQVDFAETMETENGNTEMETRKGKNHASYSIVSKTVFYFVLSWLGCYMLARGETEFCSCSAHLID